MPLKRHHWTRSSRSRSPPTRLAPGAHLRILVAAPNSAFLEALAPRLRKHNCALEISGDLGAASFRLIRERYDLVVFDVEWMHGIRLLVRLRTIDVNVPVLVAHAPSQASTARVLCLDLGADDCIEKSVPLEEVEARIRALLRRNSTKSPLMTCGRLSFNSTSRLFSIGDRPLELPQKEHALLQALITRPGYTHSKEALSSTLYTVSDCTSTDTVALYVHRLRRRLQGTGACIETHRGLGYLLHALPHSEAA